MTTSLLYHLQTALLHLSPSLLPPPSFSAFSISPSSIYTPASWTARSRTYRKCLTDQFQKNLGPFCGDRSDPEACCPQRQHRYTLGYTSSSFLAGPWPNSIQRHRHSFPPSLTSSEPCSQPQGPLCLSPIPNPRPSLGSLPNILHTQPDNHNHGPTTPQWSLWTCWPKTAHCPPAQPFRDDPHDQ